MRPGDGRFLFEWRRFLGVAARRLKHQGIGMRKTNVLAVALIASVGLCGVAGGQLIGGGGALAQEGDEVKVAQSGVRAPTAVARGEGDIVNKVNSWTIGLAAGLPSGTFLTIAAEIARNLNEGNEIRVLPIITPGASENVRDLC